MCKTIKHKYILIFISLILVSYSCKQKGNSPIPNAHSAIENDKIEFSKLTDTYPDIRGQEHSDQWGVYNVHDPAIRKFGDYYYSYSTDVSYKVAVPARLGLQIRKSKNLVEWTFEGWAFDSLPPKGAAYIESIGAIPNKSLWAPFVMEVNGEYRLYYSLSSNAGNKSCIGLATSTDPVIGWKEVDIVVATDGSSIQTNGIDPSVIITPEGELWMLYGSAWDGIYIVQLDPKTGLNLKPGNLGVRIAHRGFTEGEINGNIEAPEIIFNEETGMYYLFIAYDWLATRYNIRVGRSTFIEGPYYDMFGNDLYGNSDNYPMLVAPYKFNGHSGWQGVSHCTVFEEDGQYYVAHQGRPGEDYFSLVQHVRQLFWTKDGWPIASPERYDAQPLSIFDKTSIPGKWEIIDFDYNVVPGFAREQTTPDFQTSEEIILNKDGTINSSKTDCWAFEYPWLTITLEGNTTELHVSVGRDWENNVESTLVMTGIKSDGNALWGKKLKP